MKIVVVTLLCALLATSQASGNYFCTKERGVGNISEDPELQEYLHGWVMLVWFLSLHDHCGSRNGQIIQRQLLKRVSQCPATEKQAVVERCILELMLDRVDSSFRSCATAAGSIHKSEDELRILLARETPEEFWRRVEENPSDDPTRKCF